MTRRLFIALVVGLSTTAVQAEEYTKDKLYVVYFSAFWCSPCTQMKRTTWVDNDVLSELKNYASGDHAGNKLEVDTDKEENTAALYNVSVIPTTLIVTKEGKVVRRAVGYLNKREMLKFLNSGGKGVDVSATPVIIPPVFTIKGAILILVKVIMWFLG